MPREEDRLAPRGIPGGLDNMLGGGAVARAKCCPRLQGRLEVMEHSQLGEDNMDTASSPPVGGTVAEWVARPREGHRLSDPMGLPTSPRR